MDAKCFPSSSFFSDDRQVGFWQLDAVANHSGRERPVAIDRNAVGAERAARRSSITSRSLEHNTVQHMPYFGENNKIGAQYENHLFSSSSSYLFGQILRSSLDNAYGQSADTVASHSEEEEPLNLLPDDDELLSGVTEGLEHIIQPNGGDDLEELDLFSSIGGMDLGAGSQFCLDQSGYSQGMLNFDTRSTHSFNPQLLPQYQNSLSNCSFSAERIDNKQLGRASSYGHLAELNEGVFGSSGIGSCPLPAHHYPLSNSFHNHPPGLMWSNSPSASFANGMYTAHSPQRLYGLPKAPSRALKPVLSANNLHVGSAPAIDPSVWDRRHSYSGQSPEASGFHPGSLGNMRMSNNSLHSAELGSLNFIPCSSGNGMEMPVPPKNVGLQPHHRMMNSFGSHSERVRSRRSVGGSNHADGRKQYELDIERIKLGEDNRTTLMIKNIPNKYTSKMLLAAIDERHRGTYDFLYLPIDFKNKCNVGYAFINMTDPCHIVPFYQAFNGKKWEKFNSEKVASIAYARIQGKATLISHFQNSSLMNEDKRHRPILFNTDGPNPGDQVPFPVGINVRARPGKTRATTREENHRGNSPNRVSKEVFSNGDSSSTSGREFD